MGNQSKLYEAYREDWNKAHPAVVQPDIFHAFSKAGDALGVACYYRGMSLGRGNFWNGANELFELPNGEAVEVSNDSRGVPVYARFKSVADAKAFESPRSFNEYFDYI